MKRLFRYSPLKPVMTFEQSLVCFPGSRFQVTGRRIRGAVPAVCLTVRLHLRFLRSWSEWRSCARSGPSPGASWTTAASEWCRHTQTRCSASVRSYERNDYTMSVWNESLMSKVRHVLKLSRIPRLSYSVSVKCMWLLSFFLSFRQTVPGAVPQHRANAIHLQAQADGHQT